MCMAGYYCPAGASYAIPCPGGEYCAGEGLNQTSGICDAGFYCTIKAVVPNPEDGVTG